MLLGYSQSPTSVRSIAGCLHSQQISRLSPVFLAPVRGSVQLGAPCCWGRDRSVLLWPCSRGAAPFPCCCGTFRF